MKTAKQILESLNNLNICEAVSDSLKKKIAEELKGHLGLKELPEIKEVTPFDTKKFEAELKKLTKNNEDKFLSISGDFEGMDRDSYIVKSSEGTDVATLMFGRDVYITEFKDYKTLAEKAFEMF